MPPTPTPSTIPGRAVIAGAGVFGLTGALALAARGWSVVVVERDGVPAPSASSTDVSKIVRMDYGDDDFLTDLAGRALEGWRTWNDGWDRPLFHETGFLLLAGASLAPGDFEYESRAALRARNHPVVAVGGDTLADRYPAWNGSRFPEGYLSVRAGWVESGEVVRRLAREARRAGVELHEGSAAELLVDGTRVAGVRLETGGAVRGDVTVVCAGAASGRLVPWLADRLRSVGQPVVFLRPDDPRPFAWPRFVPWAADITRTGWYGFPALPDGRVKIGHHGRGLGSGEGPLPLEVPDAHVDRLKAFLADALPGLAPAPVVGRRVCFYCDTPDGDFWIDRDPDRNGLVVASGGSGHAFKFAPVLGELVADAVEGREHRHPRLRWRTPSSDGAGGDSARSRS